MNVYIRAIISSPDVAPKAELWDDYPPDNISGCGCNGDTIKTACRMVEGERKVANYSGPRSKGN